MSGIVFPDLARSIGGAENILASRSQREWMDEDRAAKKSAAEFVPKALQGDEAALNEVGARHPDTLMKIAPLLDRMDAAKRAKAKEGSDWLIQNGMAILSAPPEQQPSIYARIKQEAQASGRDVSAWPTQYDPGWVKFNVDKALPVAEYFKRSGEGVTFAPPTAAGSTPAPGGNPGGAIKGIESGSPAGNYSAVGPPANDKGQRAYGAYQVMDFNVGPWTQEVLGKAMTPQEFLANPQAQDAVFNAKFGQYTKQYGSPEAAARAWFAGPGGMNNPNAKDVLGTTVQGYGQKFAQAYGPGATGPQPPGVPQGDSPQADASGNPLPPAQQNLQPLRGLQIPPGARVALQNGIPIVKDGNVLYLDSNGGWGAAPLPSRRDPQQAPAGYEPNPEGGGLRPIAGGPADPTVQRRERVPPGYRLTPDGGLEHIPGGPADPSVAKRASPMTEGQANAALYADRMRASEKIILENEAAGLSPTGKALEYVPGGNYAQSESYQLYEQARRDFINATLRRESGAVISDQEFANAEKQYFPRPGDKPDTLKQKAENRRIALDGISRAAGQSYQPAPTKPPEPKAGSAEKGRDDFNASKGPVKVKTPEEAAALPPGTIFETPDGRLKVRP